MKPHITLFFSVAALFLYLTSYSQNTELQGEASITWKPITQFYAVDNTTYSALNFEDASYDPGKNFLPRFQLMVALPNNASDFEVSVVPNFTQVTNEELQILKQNDIPNNLTYDKEVVWIKKKAYALINFVPIINSTNGFQKVASFTYEITPTINNIRRAKTSSGYKATSVLSNGNWGKVGITQNGVYKLTYGQLSSLGVVSGTPSSNSLRLFGNGGHHLPFKNNVPRIDDLAENAIVIVDGNDGVFNSNDYILFYAEGPHQWNYSGNEFSHVNHLFSDTNYYFITTDYNVGTPKRIENASTVGGSADISVSTFTDFKVHEQDLVNFVKSGRNWYGESFNFTKTQTFSFNFPNIVPNTQKIVARSAFRVIRRPSSLNYSINNTSILSIADNTGVGGGVYDNYANIQSGTATFSHSNDQLNIQVAFSNSSSSDNAWLDYIEIITDRNLICSENQFNFRNPSSINASVIEYKLTNTNNYVVWDVTDHISPKVITMQNGNFKANGGQLNEYIAVRGNNYLTPALFGTVPNQNLHAIQQADYIIVSHPNFLLQAQQLANHHRVQNELNTIVVTPQQIYNEFSSGAQDLTAIKTFIKMLYDRAGASPDMLPKYVLLLGDASYDMKKRMQPNTNFIPSYQSWNSYSPLNSYVSDDYIGLLDDDESDQLADGVDIGIGRFVVQTNIQAQDMVDKVIHYETSPEVLDAWQNWVTFVGDDEDRLVHMAQSDEVARTIQSKYPDYNQKKIYLDAYPQVSNAGGSTYPEVNTAIDNATEKGCLIMNYIGHGGELGWAHERVLGLPQINNYKNMDRLALFMTATCEFSRFDDPERTSGGELLHLNPNGGAIGLLTTTRLVYSGPNFILVKKFFDSVFEKENGEWPAMGDVLMAAKFGEKTVNGRNFTLLGDPAMKLRYPTYQVETTLVPDTIKSLQKVTIQGRVTNEDGTLASNFNGVIYPTIFDKATERTTLDNDGVGPFKYQDQTNALFNGKASVTNGVFEFDFIVPKDINLDYGSGKISYFTENGTKTGAGSNQQFNIGGRISNPPTDNQGPTVNVYLNDETFITGGMTDQNPLLYATIFDESGVNTVGTGIGHDITAIIDEETSNPIILNDFYSSNLDTYKSGKVNYTLRNLSDGKHTIRLKAWDVYNNSGEGYTEFYVSNSNQLKIDHVLNYPNPFTTNTDFYFEHNALGDVLTIRIQIFTISGKLVKTIDNVQNTENNRSNPIPWNGLDEYNDRLATGTYIYKLIVTNSRGEKAEKFEKIVIL